ncbi:MAG: hypothetical protein QXF38_00945 [Pyrobaculum sp.]
MYAFVDLPFSPSGVTHLTRLHKAVGFEKELREVEEVLEAALYGNVNVLAVVIAPYGWGKSELLDEVEKLAKERGFLVHRTALSLGFVIDLPTKGRDEPLLVLIDEADEISRLAAVHKLGALGDEQFMKLVQKTATLIRALLEPRSYRHILGDPERYNKVAIIAAFTPQLYYTILKNVVPDVFEITSGRVYREIVLDTRYPFWQYVETVKQRLASYSTPERIKRIESGDLDALSPFTIWELAAIYHLAKRKGEATPRYLMKLTARLFQLKKEGGRLAELLREEGVDIELDYDVLELAFAAIPFDKKIAVSKEIYLYKIPYNDKDALASIKEYLILKGVDFDIKDPKNTSYEPYVYYTLIEDGKLYVYLLSDRDIGLDNYLIGKKYIVSEDIARLLGWEETQTIAALTKEYSQKLENPLALFEEIERIAGIEGIKLKYCCGYALWLNNMGIREIHIFTHVDKEEELKKVVENLAELITQGVFNGYAIDYIDIFVTSRVLLTDTIQNSISPLLLTYWKKYYKEPASNFVTIHIYGADRFEKLKHEIIKYAINKFLKRESKLPQFVDVLRLGRERSRENIMKYTLALKKGKERKFAALIKIAEQLDQGQVVEGFKSYRQIEEIILDVIEESIHEKELKSVIGSLFPTSLWRDFREEDLVELFKLRGVVVPHGDRLYKYNIELASQYITELLRQLEELSIVKVEKQTPYGLVKEYEKINVEIYDINFEDLKTYAKVLREILLKIYEVKEKYEEVRKRLEEKIEEKIKIIKRVSLLLEKLPQRRKYLDIEKVKEEDIRREEAILQKYVEILKTWEEVKGIAKSLGLSLDVEKDLVFLLELPEPWLDDYLVNLKLYAVELQKRYEKYLEEARSKKTAAEWLRQKLGLEGEVEKIIEIAATKLGVTTKLLFAVARRGRGAVLDIEQLSTETGMERDIVEKELEKLHRVGVVEKKYVA